MANPVIAASGNQLTNQVIKKATTIKNTEVSFNDGGKKFVDDSNSIMC